MGKGARSLVRTGPNTAFIPEWTQKSREKLEISRDRPHRVIRLIGYLSVTGRCRLVFNFGEMAERLKAQHWKCCLGYPPNEGSNPSLSVVILGLKPLRHPSRSMAKSPWPF
jgi:hypothetical protein